MEKLKIFSFSDIHVDINIQNANKNESIKEKFIDGFKEYLNTLENIDIVICAGDVSSNLQEIEKLLKLVTENVDAKYYVFVPGNHDVWETEQKVDDGISRIKYEDYIPEVVSQTKFHYLPKNPLIIDDSVAIIGNIGWYDYSFRNKKWDCYLKEKMDWYYKKTINGSVWNDVLFAGWGMNDTEVVKYCIKDLEEDYEKIKHISNKIAILHHIPFSKGIVYKNDINWDYFNAFMGSTYFGEKLIKWNIDTVVYGHTHIPHSYVINNCQVYCSTIGYHYEWDNKNLQKMFAQRTQLFDFKIDTKK